MCTESVKVGYIFLACHGGLAKYQTCLIFHRPSTTLYIWTVAPPTWKHFPSCPILLLFFLEKLVILSWFSSRTPPPGRPATLTDRT